MYLLKVREKYDLTTTDNATVLKAFTLMNIETLKYAIKDYKQNHVVKYLSRNYERIGNWIVALNAPYFIALSRILPPGTFIPFNEVVYINGQRREYLPSVGPAPAKFFKLWQSVTGISVPGFPVQ